MYEMELVVDGGTVVLKGHRAGSQERNRIGLLPHDVVLVGNHDACDIRLTSLPSGCVLVVISVVGEGLRLQVTSAAVQVYLSGIPVYDFAPMFADEELRIGNFTFKLAIHYMIPGNNIFQAVPSEQVVRCSAINRGARCTKAGRITRIPPYEVASWICDKCVQIRRGANSDNLERHSIGNFELLGKVASGGFGTVFEAVNKVNNVHSAVKMVSWEPMAGRTMARFIDREQRIHRHLTHPHIVRYYDSGCPDDTYFIAMEFMVEGSLKDAIEKKNVTLRKLKEIVVLAVDLFEAVAYLHHFGYVHRDLKPANVFLTQRDENNFYRLKIGDFGLLKQCGQHADMSTSDELLGTPFYMAPEVAVSGGFKCFAPSSDLYSAAATIYWILAGRPPIDDPVTDGMPANNRGNGLSDYARRVVAARDAERLKIKNVPISQIFREDEHFDEVADVLDQLLLLDPSHRSEKNWTAAKLAKFFQRFL